MKKLILMILSAALCLTMFAACAEEDVAPSTEATTLPTVDTTEPTVPVDEILAVPEKTVSIEDVDALTVTVTTTSSYGIARKITYSIRDEGESVTFYECNTEAKLDVDAFQVYEYLCTENGLFENWTGTGAGFQSMDMSGEFDTNDGYFRRELANLGFDYADHFQTDGFSKEEDVTYMGRECYVYQTAYTDVVGAAYKARIYVDKQTGIWLRSQRTIPGTEDTFLMEVTSLEETAEAIPGTQPVDMAEQVIFDQDGVTVTAKALDFTDPNGAVLRLEIANGTEGDIRVTSRYVDVDGRYFGADLLSVHCPVGQTQQATVVLSNRSLDRSHILTIGQIELSLQIEDVHVEAGNVVSDGFRTPNSGALIINTAAGEGQTADTEGKLLVQSDAVCLELDGFRVEASGDAWFGVHYENAMAEPLRVRIGLVSVDDIVYEESRQIQIPRSAEGFAGFSISRDMLLDIGTDQIGSVQFTVTVYDGSGACIVEQTEVISVALK